MIKPEQKTDWYAVKVNLEKEQIITLFLKFNALRPDVQQGIWEEWNQYFKDVQESPMAKLARDMADAIERNDLPALDGLKQLRKDLDSNTVSKPKSFPIDPMTFYHDQQVYLYKKAVEEIARGKASVSF